VRTSIFSSLEYQFTAQCSDFIHLISPQQQNICWWQIQDKPENFKPALLSPWLKFNRLPAV
jgi:hypothetical protein